MESLNGSDFDIVIAGTGLHESLLALALSRSGKNVLHVDKNKYYGGSSAALNLQDAADWVKAVNGGQEELFASASIFNPTSSSGLSSGSLGDARRYTLSLSPSIIHARSSLISTLVSARVDQQIDFVANGSTWLRQRHDSPDETHALKKVPNSREDIVQDDSIDRRAKLRITKFLRFVADLEEQREIWQPEADHPLKPFLEHQFGIEARLQEPIVALAMSRNEPARTATGWALRRVEQHLKSMNVLGPGFGSVIPKWGGLAEIVQVACRALAVGGGVYVLGQGLTDIRKDEDNEPTETNQKFSNLIDAQHHTDEVRKPRNTVARLSDGSEVKCDWVVAGFDNTVARFKGFSAVDYSSHSISIVSRPLEKLFTPPSTESPEPAGAVVRISDREVPINILAHSSATGECPAGQCVLYASTRRSGGFADLESEVQSLCTALDPSATVLWRLQYERKFLNAFQSEPNINSREHVITFPSLSADLVFDDEILQMVKKAWRAVLGRAEGEVEDFMKFAPRQGELDESEEG